MRTASRNPILPATIAVVFAAGFSTGASQPPADPVAGIDAGAAAAELTGTLRLEDALALALLHNPELHAFSYEVRAREAAGVQAGTIPNPQFDLRMQRLGSAPPSIDPDTERLRVIVSQEIELGGKRRRRFDLAEGERAVAESDWAAKRGEVAAAVESRFVELLGAQQRLQSMQEHVRFFTAMRDQVAGLVQSGILRTVEVHEVGRRLGLEQIDLRRVEIEHAAVRFRLAATWGSSTPRFDSVVGDLERIAPLPDLERVLELAHQGPIVERADAELAKGEAALALARAERIPDLTYGVGVRWEKDAQERDYLVDLEIDLPIFDRNRGAVRAAQHELARARALRSAAATQSTEAVTEVYFGLVEADARRAILAEVVLPAARDAFESQHKGFESGADNLKPMLDARRDLVRAEVDHADALVDCHRARAALAALIGFDGNW